MTMIHYNKLALDFWAGQSDLKQKRLKVVAHGIDNFYCRNFQRVKKNEYKNNLHRDTAFLRKCAGF